MTLSSYQLLELERLAQELLDETWCERVAAGNAERDALDEPDDPEAVEAVDEAREQLRDRLEELLFEAVASGAWDIPERHRRTG